MKARKLENIIQKQVLGVRVDMVDRTKTLEILAREISDGGRRRPFHLVTAYSEFFVRAGDDPDFKKVLNNADLVVPDGVGPLAAIDYERIVFSDDLLLVKLWKGLVVGVRVLEGKVGLPVSGVWLFYRIMELAERNRWKIFLLGGFGELAKRLEENIRGLHPSIQIDSDGGFMIDNDGLEIGMNKKDEDFERLVKKINDSCPDVVFVAYGPVKQEKWIARNKNRLKTRVLVGVGGTFNEMMEQWRETPVLIEKAGLKWLWRFFIEPGRWKRTLSAFPVFPWLVFKQVLGRKNHR